MIVEIQLIKPDAVIPKIKTVGSKGADLYACMDEEKIIIEPGETAFIPLGFKTSFSPKYAALIYARSGLACKSGLAPANKVGVIDSDYRGEWIVALHNHSTEPRTVCKFDRIAQVLFHEVENPEFTIVDEVDETERGEGGFNSTGSN